MVPVCGRILITAMTIIIIMMMSLPNDYASIQLLMMIRMIIDDGTLCAAEDHNSSDYHDQDDVLA